MSYYYSSALRARDFASIRARSVRIAFLTSLSGVAHQVVARSIHIPLFTGRRFRPFSIRFHTCLLIELKEDVRMMSNIIDCDPNTVEIGMPVEVTFEDVTEEITLPQFKPSQG